MNGGSHNNWQIARDHVAGAAHVAAGQFGNGARGVAAVGAGADIGKHTTGIGRVFVARAGRSRLHAAGRVADNLGAVRPGGRGGAFVVALFFLGAAKGGRGQNRREAAGEDGLPRGGCLHGVSLRSEGASERCPCEKGGGT